MSWRVVRGAEVALAKHQLNQLHDMVVDLIEEVNMCKCLIYIRVIEYREGLQ